VDEWKRETSLSLPLGKKKQNFKDWHVQLAMDYRKDQFLSMMGKNPTKTF
jgi:hypothetical protein